MFRNKRLELEFFGFFFGLIWVGVFFVSLWIGDSSSFVFWSKCFGELGCFYSFVGLEF